MRFSVGRSAALAHTFEDEYGDIVSPSSVTVAVTKYGTAVVSGSATADGDGWKFNAGSLAQGVYQVTWTAAGYVDSETFEVVGRHLFTVRELRAFDEELQDESRFTAEKILRYRDVVTDDFESITGRSFIPRTVRVPWSGSALLPRMDVAAATLYDGALWDTLELDDDPPFGYISDVYNVDGDTLELDYGFRTPPLAVKEQAMNYCRWMLHKERSGIPDRATSFQPVEGGSYVLATPGQGRWKTGIPDVDRVLGDYTFNIINDWGIA